MQLHVLTAVDGLMHAPSGVAINEKWWLSRQRAFISYLHCTCTFLNIF